MALFIRQSYRIYVHRRRRSQQDFQAASSRGGENYGWPFFEGTLGYRGSTNGANFVRPIEVFTGPRGRGSVTGGYMNHANPEVRLNGLYVFGDFVSGRMYGLRRAGENWSRKELAATPFPISTF